MLLTFKAVFHQATLFARNEKKKSDNLIGRLLINKNIRHEKVGSVPTFLQFMQITLSNGKQPLAPALFPQEVKLSGIRQRKIIKVVGRNLTHWVKIAPSWL